MRFLPARPPPCVEPQPRLLASPTPLASRQFHLAARAVKNAFCFAPKGLGGSVYVWGITGVMKPRQHRGFLDRIKGFKVSEACGFPLGGFIDGMKKRYYLAYARNAEVAQHASPISFVLPFWFRLCGFQTCIFSPRCWWCCTTSS